MAGGGAALSAALALWLLLWYIPEGLSETGPKGTFFKPLFCDTTQMYPEVCQYNGSTAERKICEDHGCCYLHILCYKKQEGVCGHPNLGNSCRTTWGRPITDPTGCHKADCCYRSPACIQPSLRKTMQRFRLLAVVGGGILTSAMLLYCFITKRQWLKEEEASSEKRRRDEVGTYLLELLEESEEERDKLERRRRSSSLKEWNAVMPQPGRTRN